MLFNQVKSKGDLLRLEVIGQPFFINRMYGSGCLCTNELYWIINGLSIAERRSNDITMPNTCNKGIVLAIHKSNNLYVKTCQLSA